ncbi:PQQ-binding-like beta-propeller repeat protein [Ornithinimicrobium faecis]|uniref:PQQ-binding-like beta-propeller repeat protein n=1 Tax=Ornithinimicrobium faecis TaxID=2934158 RepID=A0ABY4YQ49_9MICO|nr:MULTISPECIES: PQQ-binding-like beta-propeller repeat protein [unclassified Ornithinimicrobium]USQ78681.1 PQQ-binding-like beta-propeller repeat protein [Ornithinimicrobium sp. HY1793]
MRHSTLLTVLPCVALAITACQGGEVESSQNGTPTSLTSSGPPPPPDGEASSSTAPGDTVTSSAAPGEASAVTSEAQTLAEVLWRNADVVPASDPVSVGDALVLYTIEDQRLQITGVDPQDGAVLWSKAATASVRPRGQDLNVETVDGLVAHLAPGAAGPESVGAPSHVILRDPVTGEDVLSSRRALSHADLPSPCAHDDTLACVTVPVDEQWSVQALAPDGGFATPPADGAGVPGWTSIGPLGISRGAETGTQVGRVADGRLAWEIDTTEAFGPGQSTNTGWSFDNFADDSVLVGTIGLGISPPADGDTWDMTQSVALGLDAETGETLWRAPATSIFCDTDITGAPDDPLLACLWNEGQAEAVEGALTYQDVNIDLVRLDPLTGDRLWQVTLGATAEDGEPARPEPRLVSSTQIAVEAADGMRVIDLETGEDRPATTADRHWVEDYDVVDVETPGIGDDEVMVSGRYRLQDGAGDLADDAPWPLPATIGVELDDGSTLVVAEPDGLTAYTDPVSGG